MMHFDASGLARTICDSLVARKGIVSVERLLLRPSEVADSLGLSRSKVYALIAARTLPSVQLGGRTLVPAEALRQWLAEQQAAGEQGGNARG